MLPSPAESSLRRYRIRRAASRLKLDSVDQDRPATARGELTYQFGFLLDLSWAKAIGILNESIMCVSPFPPSYMPSIPIDFQFAS